ncbi:putative CAAX prenyl protease [Rhodotorula sp. JG-1b]|nr:putative CAAX prenyl protease [Rhodotorula sp. JG-1b]
MTALLHQLQGALADPSIPWRSVLLASIGAKEVFETYVGSRQRPYLSPVLHPTLPNALKPYLTAPDAHDTYRKSQAYARHKLDYGSVMTVLDLGETAVLLTGVALPVWKALGLPGGEQSQWTLLRGFWDLAARMPFAGAGANEIRQSAAFVVLLTVVGTVLSLPKEYYRNFVLEERHGFNKMTRATFAKDQVKGLFVSLALEVPLVAGLIKIIHWAGSDAILRMVTWLIVFIFCIQIAMIFVYPYVIMPLFNKFTPLPTDSPIYPRVKDLAEKLDFPLGKVWVIDGSIRSSHSNAFFFGLPGLQKHIVLYDTLLEKSKPEEVEAILAHELGHWKGMHVVYLLTVALTQVAVSFSVYALFLENGALLSAFGFPPSVAASPLEAIKNKLGMSHGGTGPTIVAVLLASMLVSPLSSFLQFITNSITRHLEYDADAFATKLGTSYAVNLKKALVTIHEKNLAVYGVDHVYSAYNHNHPTLVERLEALDSQLARDTKKST